MMKKLHLAATAAVLAMGFATSVSATAIYVIDDFLSAPPNPFSANLMTQGQASTDGPDTYTINGLSFTRTVLFQNIADTSIAYGASINISNGDLKIVNGPTVRSRTTLTYDVSALKALTPIDSWAALGIIFSNGTSSLNGPTTIQGFINNSLVGGIDTSLGTLTLTSYIDATGNIANEVWGGLGLLNSQLTGTNDILKFVINGPADYDLTLDQIDFAVPEPAMLGLFGMGVLGLGIARRRKR